MSTTVPRWEPSQEPTARERRLLARLKRTRKLFAFLRNHRDEIFDEAFQDELAGMYRGTGAGKDPVPPALLAMASLLQGYMRASDAEAVELTVTDLRWQMVLDVLGSEEPAFAQGTLREFRERMIRHDMDVRLLRRTSEVARGTGGFDARKLPKTLRVAVDSAPLAGAGKVEDTLNLLGHAARNVVACAATLSGLDADELCRQAGIPVLLASSVKRGLDRDWAAPGATEAAATELAGQLEALRSWLDEHLKEETARPPLQAHLETLTQIETQDLEPDPGGGGRRIRRGVARDRRISVEDAEMRHGRKSSSRRIDGYKRHIAIELGDRIVEACNLRPANEPEANALKPLADAVESDGRRIGELFIDRAYVSSPVVGVITARGGTVVCRPWRQGNRGLFTKEDFAIDLDGRTVTCPAGETQAMGAGHVVEFNPTACDACTLRTQCTKAKAGRGRSIHIAEDEALQRQLRELASTPEGRDRLRERVPVEHRLAHVTARQGDRARYVGARKNEYDLRRTCAILNLETAQRLEARAATAMREAA